MTFPPEIVFTEPRGLRSAALVACVFTTASCGSSEGVDVEIYEIGTPAVSFSETEGMRLTATT